MAEIATKFWHFDQNNPGGFFFIDMDKAEDMWFEAISAEDANHRAKMFGLTLDGDECPGCCGSRWDSQYSESDGKESPEIFVRSDHKDPGRMLSLPDAQQWLNSLDRPTTWGDPGSWTDPGLPWAIVVHMDGRVERFIKPEISVGEKEDDKA